MICWALTIDHIYEIDEDRKIWRTTLETVEDCPNFVRMTEACSTASIAVPRMTCGGKLLLKVLRGSSVIASVAKDFIYTSAGGRIVMINLSSTPGSFEIYRGSWKTI